MSFATLVARSNVEARLFNNDELVKECNPPEFRMSTPDFEPGCVRCWDASSFNGAAEGRSS
eukprot:CAMPEP_0201650834 /NCGR_PEP_ID=MMETSP0493-20130528/41935_1 /ASSEMBLY_ACC=CAM_ASM_000838 /TAXON_ID=420259 /ORGANISM="Thalassiosira gravida, Strain GMp14c1" /LENGTH=60 /DNA_ID=CAMNT_0048127025 /DNA_START=119 /DNA_END=298 /DNA_ORIENTATION=+